MAYPIDVMLIINPPQDYPSWDRPRRIARAEAAVEFHNYIRKYNKQGKIKWAWGSYPLYSAFRSRVNLNSYVVVYSAPSMEDYNSFMVGCPLTDSSIFVTAPLTSLTTDFEEDEQTLQETQSFPDDQESILQRTRVRAEYLQAPSYYDPQRIAAREPPNIPTDFSRVDDRGISYLLYGLGPEQMTHWTDFRRSIYTEKIFWWYAYLNDLISKGKVTHGWSITAFCDVVRPRSATKGAGVVLQATDLSELNHLYRRNPLLDEAEFFSVALKPIGQQRLEDIAFAKALKRKRSRGK